MSTTTKPWWRSRTLVGAIVTAVSFALQRSGVIDLSDAEQQSLVDAILTTVEAGGLGLVAWGRSVASSRLTLQAAPVATLFAVLAVAAVLAPLGGCAEYTAAKGAVEEVYEQVREERASLRLSRFEVLRTGLCEADPKTVAEMISAGRLDIESYAGVCTSTYGVVYDKARAVK